MTTPLKIAIAGLGTVGMGTIEILRANSQTLKRRAQRPFEVVAVSARDRGRDRGADISNFCWYDDPVKMATEVDCDVVLELIGGGGGIAKSVCENAIAKGRHIVTANKALLALHGTELARASESAGVAFCYEAAVAGGIPVIKTLRESLSGNSVSRIQGILNGTCNFILSSMRSSGSAFGEVLAEAQKLGYAESDPSLDIDGVDAAHKLAILSSIAFGTELDFEGVHVEGIRSISAEDIAFADELGFRIKLLGIAEKTPEGIRQRVHPAMVPISAPISAIEGVLNGVSIEGDFVGPVMLEGAGAGGGPTASAVVADLVDIACNRILPLLGVSSSYLTRPAINPMEDHKGAYFIRMMVYDRPGVLADISATLRDHDISIEGVIQRKRSATEAVPVVVTVHETTERSMNAAMKKIAGIEAIQSPIQAIRIEQN